jgi:hypothetical protein
VSGAKVRAKQGGVAADVAHSLSIALAEIVCAFDFKGDIRMYVEAETTANTKQVGGRCPKYLSKNGYLSVVLGAKCGCRGQGGDREQHDG